MTSSDQGFVRYEQQRLRSFWTNRLMQGLTGAFAYFSIIVTVGITLILLWESVEFFRELVSLGYSWTALFRETVWTPVFEPPGFGIVAIIAGTLITSIIAMIVALPVGLLSAIFLSEYAPPLLRTILKPVLEVLSGVPTVVYGFFALLVVGPALQRIIPNGEEIVSGLNATSAGFVMGIMIIPLVASLSEDAIYAVPNLLREGSYGLGATKFETTVSVVIPSALSGIVSAFILAVSRAVGETMIVALAAGQNPVLNLNPLQAVMTITAFIVQVSLGDTPTGTLAFYSIFLAGFILFLITLVLNILADRFVRKYRLVY
ncbi:phosphate ABC transporter, permease protein [Gloeomargarita lithophora Alchichica-D10]|uniref:Phosphate transport system permease protein n=1 Tax=Gloeomargarita lithophora Alchichica-D10 TaxID=1188229 RepID=A0A1J0AEY8_9CYAN|nr:phosphate ABC transporter permease subunit PstC [Gloeomargarita lithophora]APB34510.1 phosphate ABC transporter, permease protein [Gloeomargarita lithophora Alchichica-D10]